MSGTLLVVIDPVFDTRHHAFGLYAVNLSCGQHSGQNRVLSKILKVSPANWNPGEVDAGA